MAQDDQRKKWRGRLLASGEGRMGPVDDDARPHPQVAQGLDALRRAPRPTLRRPVAPRFRHPSAGEGETVAAVHPFPQRRGEPDTAPGRPPGDPPSPDLPRDPGVARTNLGWGTQPPEAPPVVAASPDELVTVSRAELERMVSASVKAQLDPIAAAISDIRQHMVAERPSPPASIEEMAGPPVPVEPMALLPILDDAPPTEPVVALTIPDGNDWTKGTTEEFAPVPALAQG